MANGKLRVINGCFAAIVIFVLYTYTFTDDYSSDAASERKPRLTGSAVEDSNCLNFIHDGRFENNKWNPIGCKMHEYTTGEFQKCMLRRANNRNKTNHLVFAGDFIIRQIFDSFKCLLLGTKYVKKVYREDRFFNHTETLTNMEFRWTPEGGKMLPFIKLWDETYKNSKPDFLFMHFLLWHVMHAFKTDDDVTDKRFINIYTNNISQIATELDKHVSTTDIIWGLFQPINQSRIATREKDPSSWLKVFAQYNNKFPTSSKNLGDLYNDVAMEALQKTNINTWSVFYNLGKYFLDKTVQPDCTHYPDEQLLIITQILANYLCNSVVDHNDGTCCKNME